MVKPRFRHTSRGWFYLLRWVDGNNRIITAPVGPYDTLDLAYRSCIRKPYR